MRRAARKDGNHAQVVAIFRAHGASVEVLEPRDRGRITGGLPDLLVGYEGVNELVEVKTPGESLNERQKQWHRTWVGARPVVVCHAEECIEVLRAMREAGNP